MKTAVIYTRTRNDDSQLARALTSEQIRACKEYAQANDIEVIDVYSDMVFRDKKPPYPSWNNIMNMKNPIFDIVLIYRNDRLGRNYESVRNDRLTLKERGVRVVSVTDGLPDDMEVMLLEFLQDYEENLHDRK